MRSINHLDLLGSDSDFKGNEILTPLQNQIVQGCLLGDFYAGWSTPGCAAYLRCEHAWSQIGYVKILYELLRPFSFSPFFDRPNKANQDFQVGFTCHTSSQFAPYRNVFYTVRTSSRHLQKDVMVDAISNSMTLISLAFWIMDDGKKRGAAFSLVIGRQAHYSFEKAERMVGLLNEKLSADFRVKEDKICYEIWVNKDSPIIDKVRPYILPMFSYKLRLDPEECGSFYKDFEWYREWDWSHVPSRPKAYVGVPAQCVCGKTFNSNMSLIRHGTKCSQYKPHEREIVVVSRLDEETFKRLYFTYGFRMKEIGSVFGITEDAVLKKAHLYNIPTNPRGTLRRDVKVEFTGIRKDKKKLLTDDLLRGYCSEGLSDAAIGKKYGMTGEGVAYRRKLIGIAQMDKFNLVDEARKRLKETDKVKLSSDYYTFTKEKFSEKYGVSVTVWRPILRERGIVDKIIHRIEKYPPLTTDQKNLILGGLLGDGSVSQGDYYYEFHCRQQEQYLRKKHDMLLPYSNDVYPEADGFRFKTTQHPVFKELYSHFYSDGKKQIPVDYLKAYWHGHILAYWYLDDGHFDDETNELSISNKSPFDQLSDFLVFLEKQYGWGYHCSKGKDINLLTFSKRYYHDFFDILKVIATPDMYYKIPEEFLTKELVEQAPLRDARDVFPKFYRLSEECRRNALITVLVENFKVTGFPEPFLTERRRKYLMSIQGERAQFHLRESMNPSMYDKARSLWFSEEFLKRVASVVLEKEHRITGSTVRGVVREELGIF